MKQKKAIIFFSAGLGDAVLLIPLARSLKKQGFKVDGFFNSPFPSEDIFKDSGILDEIIICRNKFKQLLFALTHISSYEKVFLNFFSANRSNLTTACLIGKNVYTNRKISSFVWDLFKTHIHFTEPAPRMHDAEQNLLLNGETKTISLEDIRIEFIKKEVKQFPSSFIAVQLSAGNNNAPYKNWPVYHWAEFLRSTLNEHPEKKIVLLGDNHETGLSEQLQKDLGERIVSLTGKTTVKEAMNILAHCDLFVGLDGGLMHLAAALGKPTFTIWGATNPVLYGYERVNPFMHRCLSLKLKCSPCSAWINPNTSRVSSPAMCPDLACLCDLSPKMAFEQFGLFINSLPVHAG